MAVTILDNRTVVDEADAITGWTSSTGTPTVFTTAPDPVESTACLGIQVSTATEDIYHTLPAGADLTDTLVYVWMLPGGVLDTTVNGGIQIYLGDGTNAAGYHVGGSNGAGFRHDDGPVVWQCFAIDTGNLPANNTTLAGGGAASLVVTSIDDIGGVFKTLAKSVGGQENCFIDILFYGNDGLTITGGGTGTEGKFLEIAQRDRSTADHVITPSATSGAYGICRELGADLIGLQGPLTFGDSGGTGSIDFADSGQTVVFEDRGFATNKYYMKVTGNATGTTAFNLGVRTSATTGARGCSLVVPAGVGGEFRASSPNIDSCGLYGCTLNGFTNGITFSDDVTNAPNHEIFSTGFTGNGEIVIGNTTFKNNSIAGTTDSAATSMISATNVSDLTFTNAGGNDVGIRIDSSGTYDFTNIIFNGYSDSTGSNLNVGSGALNAAVWNNSGGAVTINVIGGDTPSVRNGVGATTIVNNNISITVTNMKDNTEVRVYLTSTLDTTPPYATPTEVAGIENATAGTTDARTFTFSVAAGTGLTIRTFNENWIADDITITPTSSQDVQVSQRLDRVFSNPV